MTRLSRRDLLKRVGAAAGAGTLAAPAIARGGIPSLPDRGKWSARLQPSGQQSENVPITVGGRAVEVILTPVSAVTSRITVVPVPTGGDTDIFAPAFSVDGSLVTRTWRSPAARFTTLVERRTVRSGDLTVVAAPRDVRQAEVTAFGVQIQTADGRAPFTLRVDERTGGLTFSLGGGAILGLGEGGPQFDRRGSTDRMRSGQGGYQLRTHGGRVPVQWLIGTGGWAMFIHQPLGTFDLTGTEGALRRAGRPLPPRCRSTSSSSARAIRPAIMAEYARAHRPSRDAAALVVRLPAVASHARRAARRSCRTRRRSARRSCRATR